MNIITTIIIVLLITGWLVFGLRSYLKRIAAGCCGADATKVKIKADKNISHYSSKLIVCILGMHCKNCALHIENALNGRGDCYAKVTLKDNTATIYCRSAADKSSICETIENAGYSVSDFKEVSL